MATIDSTHQIRKNDHLWEWKVGPTSSPDATYDFDMPEAFEELRAHCELTGDRTVKPLPFTATSRDADDSGDDVMSTSDASTAIVYLFRNPGRVRFVVGGSTGSVHIKLQAYTLGAQWRGQDLP